MPEPYSLDLRERVFRYVDEVRAARLRRISGCRFPLSSTW
jgi:hypothetical protein